MKKFLLCSASALAIAVATGNVHAADDIADPGYGSWDGWYFGAHLGAGKTSGELAPDSNDHTYSKGGSVGGLQFGYNQDVGDYIWGLEADVSFSDLQGRSEGHSIGPDGMATIRARLGMEIGNGALAYITGGAGALWGVTTSSDGSNNNSFEVWRPVFGAGIEAALNENLSIRAEGLAYLGTDSPIGPTERNNLEAVYVARLGINYHLNGTNYGRVAGTADGSWDGWYFGGHLGAAKVGGELADNSDDFKYHRGGAVGGLQLGFNRINGNYIWGLEGDISFADLQFDANHHGMGPDAMASIRGKVGMEIGSGAYAYVTGGAGVLWGISTSSAGSQSDNYAVWRPVVGVGVEAPLNENFTVTAEGLAYIGSDGPTPPTDANIIDNVFVARLGINYHLNGTNYGRAVAERPDPANSSWDGFYFGAFLGSGKLSGEMAPDSDDWTFSKAGSLAGLQLGYNQEMGDYIWGIEGDLGFADLTHRIQFLHHIGVAGLGSIRGRIGMEVGGGAFAYVTGGAGALWGTTGSSDDDNEPFVAWRPVVGAGLEAPINEFLTFKAEGLAYLGSNSPIGPSERNQIDDVFVTRLGINYHLNGTTYGKIAEAADPLNGWYFGAHLGAAKTSGELAPDSDDWTFSKAGALAGLQLGYNQENNGYIWGLEADVSLADMELSQFGHGVSPNAMGSLRGRLGVAIGNDTFAYITGGAGVLIGTTTSSDGSNNNGFDVYRPVVGFGVETPLNDRFTIKAEGLAYLGSDSPIGPSERNQLDDVFTARLGINYHM